MTAVSELAQPRGLASGEPIGPASAGLLRSARRLRLRKHRRAEGRLLAEGVPAVQEAIAAGVVETVLATAAAAEQYPDLVADGWWEVSPAQLSDLADTVHPAGVLALCRWQAAGLERLQRLQPELVIVCAQIRDPGNAGTIIRCADAFGAGAVVLTDGSVDASNPKTVRASTGSIFHLPVISADLALAIDRLRAQGCLIVAADGHGDQDLTELARSGQFNRPVAWVMGNEAWGLPQADRQLVDATVRVPMWGQAESLNLATAAAICLYTTAAAQRL
ncbi:MAG: RNA methyltransferase [Propionibacteriaceae bacterium]|jgi:TrmH family RNA methyltransferase|nr:RNA methyltransferase [Propionibacteriaceae bacterium]